MPIPIRRGMIYEARENERGRRIAQAKTLVRIPLIGPSAANPGIERSILKIWNIDPS